ncbi:MAG: tetratricopeptide repeat protein [Alphaproteobacteria bacterium]|nr:sel1 repeat family protein [Rhodospirillaceae bacterium]MDG2482929.1 tetratricopeptide repeat protein [Alphaproteobacteria bacterium]MBT6203143.1 sel1 repeat family protein [Rhodospirillaceae bacterium]MBT6511464.1 sel1 repeat family protein [Rhodospirillaceae bacterium]MBT7614872.1 sel1 repeat family protein [Rhodospirillaceae bacterium]
MLLALSLAACGPPSPGNRDLPPELYETIAVAEAGDPVAQTVVGTMYETGVFGEPDYRTAALWYAKAVRQGDALAAFYLAGLSEEGRGVDRDYVSAANLYRRAAEWGHVSAAFKLGYLYEKGLGVPQDFAQARDWYDLVQDHWGGGGLLLPDYVAGATIEGGDTVIASTPADVAQVTSAYQVHLGSERSAEAALAQWEILKVRYAGLLGARTPVLARLELAGGATYYQLLAGPLADGSAADILCAQLQPQGQYCDPVPPQG